jgi:rubrerythrin
MAHRGNAGHERSGRETTAMTPDQLFFLYVIAWLAALSAVAVYYEFRRKRFEPEPSEDNIFRCEKCAFVYTDDADVDRSRCPQCGAVNTVFKF